MNVVMIDQPKSSVVLDTSKANKIVNNGNGNNAATLAIEDDVSDTHSIQSTRSNLLANGNDSSCGWYPTLQKTLWILSKLYRCVQVSLGMIYFIF
jgi:hypothetical protein